ncbi:Succinyl-CoA--L-malate CoA-transferase alpha subunit [BD1-7 clade bacterium]|uniref:Succinyl-CoA--L-malate CoA-transferase alpha subunit n=1 Tax=BD1-7 clade bacterium TaxID=2029982 RepID=A0A5S9PJT3_9GAMM|nr:Succinyl-CoA--L-malate CoA-transferase alpha subunit [BD1-7 clade bacterium]CAA0104320.1 Succinyl-CoA--L-malate CoA-transferase alpha subunit [BD1-7 clade bacterium]
MLNNRQREIYQWLGQGSHFDYDPSNYSERILQTPGYIDSDVEVNNIAVAAMTLWANAVARIADTRGLGKQGFTIDQRHASLMLNSAVLHFQNGIQFSVGPVREKLNNFYATQDDKHVFFQGSYQTLREKLLAFLDCPNSEARIQAATAGFNARDLDNQVAELGLCAAILHTREEWLSTDIGRSIAQKPMLDVSSMHHGAPVPLSKSVKRPLENIRVVDLTKVVAGPNISHQLAEQGADVIHCRHPYQDHTIPFQIEASYGKKNIFLDFSRSNDKALLQDLIRTADVVVDGLGAGGFSHAGFSKEALLALNPNLIYVQINCYDFDHAWEHRKGWEQLAQTVSGLAYLHSKGDVNNLKLIPAFFNDYLTGYLGACGVVEALLNRAEHGGAWNVRVSLVKTAMMAARFATGNGKHDPIGTHDLETYLQDEDSGIGVLTRLRPPIDFDVTKSFSGRPASYPGTDPQDIGWGEDALYSDLPRHRKSQLLDRNYIFNPISI